MPSLKYIWFWPNGGPRHGGWGDGPPSAPSDAFVKSSRRVTEAVSEVLKECDLPFSKASLQVFARTRDEYRPVTLISTKPKREEGALIVVPPDAHEMSGAERGALVLGAVREVLDEMGRVWDWDLPALHAVLDGVPVDAPFEMRGKWSKGPNGVEVRPAASILDSGWSEYFFEVRPRGSEGPGTRTNSIESGDNSLPKFKRFQTEYRWSGDVIERPKEWVELDDRWSEVDRFHVVMR